MGPVRPPVAGPRQSVSVLVLLENSLALSQVWTDLRDKCLDRLVGGICLANRSALIRFSVLESSHYGTSALGPRLYQDYKDGLRNIEFDKNPENKLTRGHIQKCVEFLDLAQTRGRSSLSHLLIVAATAPSEDSKFYGNEQPSWVALAHKMGSSHIHCHLVLSSPNGMGSLTSLFEQTLRIQGNVEGFLSPPVDLTNVVLRLSARHNWKDRYSQDIKASSDSSIIVPGGIPPRNLYPLDNFHTVKTFDEGTGAPRPAEGDQPPSLVTQPQQVHKSTKKRVYGTKQQQQPPPATTPVVRAPPVIQLSSILPENPGTRPNVENSSDQEFDLKHSIEAMTCLMIVAENAMQHVKKQMLFISETFEQWRIPKSSFHVQAGFDEPLIASGIGWLEQIHIFVGVPIEADSPLLYGLGKMCSPFSSILFTDACQHYLPIVKDDGSIYEFNDFVSHNATRMWNYGATAEAPLVAISCSMTPNVNSTATGFNTQETSKDGDQGKGRGNSSNKGKKKESGGNGDKEEDDGDSEDDADCGPPDHEDPEDPQRSTRSKDRRIFEHKDHSQKIAVHGDLIIETTSLSLNPPRYSERRVQFNNLTFDTEPPNDIAYRQFYARVSIDSNQENAVIKDVHPKRNAHYYGEEMESSSSTRASVGRLNGMIPMVPGVQLTAQATKQQSKGVENRRNRSPISEHHGDGSVRWGFPIEDVKLQKEGIDMLAQGILPTVRFDYVGNSDVPKNPPNNINTLIISCWSIISKGKQNRFQKFLMDLQNQTTNYYSNLFNVILLNTSLDPSSSKNPSHYKANLMVKEGMTTSTQIQRYANEQFKFDSHTADDVKKFKIPMIGDIELSQLCNVGLDKQT